MKVGPNPDWMDPDPENMKPVNRIFRTGNGICIYELIPGMVSGKVGLELENPEASKLAGWNWIKWV